MRRKPLAALGAAILLLTLSFGASANTIYCSGTVNSVYIGNDGAVVFSASYRSHYTQVCSVHGSWHSISTEICVTWYSALLAAKVHSKQVLLQYRAPAQKAAPTVNSGMGWIARAISSTRSKMRPTTRRRSISGASTRGSRK